MYQVCTDNLDYDFKPVLFTISFLIRKLNYNEPENVTFIYTGIKKSDTEHYYKIFIRGQDTN